MQKRFNKYRTLLHLKYDTLSTFAKFPTTKAPRIVHIKYKESKNIQEVFYSQFDVKDKAFENSKQRFNPFEWAHGH